MTLFLPLATLLLALPTQTSTPPPTSAAAVLAGVDGGVWPLVPRPEVVRGFELPGKPWLPGHRGVDLAGRPGQAVLAATAGTITYAGPLAGRGVITVTAGARRTTYQPVVATVTVGTTVTPGTVIGHLSAAGSHCAPATCLHWGLVQDKQYLNPLTLVPNRPVRLLPLTTTPPRPLRASTNNSPLHVSTGNARHEAAASPPDTPPTPSIDRANLAPDSPHPNNRTAATVVGGTAALMLIAGLLIRRP